ncbi:chemotaxis protein CheA [Tropicimonas isoalkanivorans]|uniref:Chemotaxis protein CheA n=1 Tax=Tropicimonas isoalkanivorans TaxID=441112 RepID=A0A1I1KCK6_9RHOB|nr:chemotaxis protein CheA [Tropicimonas isoalkanivorans]SFC58704.1 two-component system, chemotaxis family, sensor kinase CheA [Tropicimonas isoalkanivorans]
MTTPDPMAEIKASFFIECEELLEGLQDGLTQLESGDADDETVNVCFRAVHSMKGGAGAFGLDELVRFAHRYETVLDEVRAGRLATDRDVVLLFMRAADILSDIVRSCRDGETLAPGDVEPTLQHLEGLVGAQAADQEEEVIDFQPLNLCLPDLGGPDEQTYRIVFRPEPELFRSGNEPLHLLRALRDLGEVTVVADNSTVPDLDLMDPEAAYVSWTISLATSRSVEDIEEVFEFVEGLCGLTIEIAPMAPGNMDVALGDSSGLPPLTITTDEPENLTPTPDTTQIRPRLTLTEVKNEPEADPAIGAECSGSETNVTPLPTPQRTATAASNKPAGTPRAAEEGKRTTVRVDLDRIERLVNLVGELVINQAMLSQSVAQAGLPASSPVAQGLEEFMQLTRDIQDSVMMIRAQPVKSLFQRMGRIVRESSAAVGKSVRFVVKGEATEVDKTVIERLADPLTHMIRNAVDHGVEPAEKRLSAGKTSEGRITLSASHRSGRVVIELSDDGGGIDRSRVRAIAEERGLIDADAALSDAEIDELLFLPGFSTASEVSNLSGRGVGMDVVRKAIQDLGGRVTISSTPGTGTSFTISLPLTLAVLDGMVVHAAGESLVMPISAIAETMAFRHEDIRPLGPEMQVLRIRDKFVPLLDLGVELGFREPRQCYEGCVVLVIAAEDNTCGALIVDSIHDQRQVVIKGLQESYGQVRGIAAATILGDGQVALILDPVDLMANATGHTVPTCTEFKHAG